MRSKSTDALPKFSVAAAMLLSCGCDKATVPSEPGAAVTAPVPAPVAASAPVVAPTVAGVLGGAYEGTALPLSEGVWLVVGNVPYEEDTFVAVLMSGATELDRTDGKTWFPFPEECYVLGPPFAERQAGLVVISLDCQSGEDVLNSRTMARAIAPSDAITSFADLRTVWTGRLSSMHANQYSGCATGTTGRLEARPDGIWLVRKPWLEVDDEAAGADEGRPCEPLELDELETRVADKL